MLAPIERGDPAVKLFLELGEMGNPNALVLFEESEGLANNLAGRGVPAGLNLFGDKRFQLTSERDVHGSLLCDPPMSLIPAGKLCQALL